ncbi:MAG: glycosyltransferase [Nocardiopsaceae bacterium]|nr:glycosyltransferase [Nocardiopsaceae bacterium]
MRRSSKITKIKAAIACILIIGIAACALRAVVWALFVVGLYNLAISAMEAMWRLYADRSPDAQASLAWPRSVRRGDERTSFTLIVCALDEVDVIGVTLDKLVRQTHQRCQIIVSLRDHDAGTIEAVETARLRHPGRIDLVVGAYAESGKAAQLNGALPHATGDYVCPIDAECDVAPDLLRHVEALIRQTGADIVQGAVQLMNLGTRMREWFQAHNVLEYFAWYSSRMLFQVDAGFVPLGGNTVFVRTELARAAGGWPSTPTEDCAMGVLLCSRFGARVVAAFSPRLATREEVPPTIFHRKQGSLFWQRVRWLEGIFGELMRGYWLQMPTLRQKMLAGYILAAPLLQAISCALLPLAFISAFVLKVPEGLTLFLYVPLIPLAVTMISMLLALAQFGRAYRQKVRIGHFASILFLTPLYQIILALAAVWAVYRHYWGDGTWYRTGRGMQHRTTETTIRSSEGAVL